MCFFFFFQAEDGIRDLIVTGVQTCALPISRVVAFVNPREEAAPAGAAPAADAPRRALAAAGKLGYPVRQYWVIDVGTKPRLTAVFHGARLAALVPSIRVPENYLRDYRRRSIADWILLAAKIVAIGSFVGLGVILFLRLVRGGGFR